MCVPLLFPNLFPAHPPRKSQILVSIFLESKQEKRERRIPKSKISHSRILKIAQVANVSVFLSPVDARELGCQLSLGPDQTLALIRFDLIDVRLGGSVEGDSVAFGVWGVEEERRFGWVDGVEEGEGKVDVREVKWRRGLGGCR